MRKSIAIVLPVVVLLLGAGSAALLIVKKRQIKPQPVSVLPPSVRVVMASPTNHQFHVLSQGTVQPRRDIQLVAEVAGRVVAVAPSLAAGGFFEEDEVLVRIDPRDYQLAVTRAEAQVRQSEVQRQREEAEAEVARQEWEELGKGEASPLLLRQPQLAEAAASVLAAGAALEQAKLDLERCEVRAPFAGRVWDKRVDVGQFVTRGSVLARLYSVDYAEIRLPLPLEELAFVGLPVDYRAGPGQPDPPIVRLRGNIAGANETWTGRVVRMEGEIDPRSRMATLVAQVADPYHRRAEPKEDGAVLPVGLFVEATILGAHIQGVFVLPRTVLRGRGTVLVVGERNRLEIRDVKVVQTDRSHVIVGKGLKGGERLVNSLLDTAVDGMEVRVEGAPADAAAGDGTGAGTL